MGFPALLIGGAILGGIIYAATRDDDKSSSSDSLSYDDSEERRQEEINQCNEQIEKANKIIDSAYSQYKSYCNAAFSALQETKFFTLGDMDLSKDCFLQICNEDYDEEDAYPDQYDLEEDGYVPLMFFTKYTNLDSCEFSEEAEKLKDLIMSCNDDLEEIDELLEQLPNTD